MSAGAGGVVAGEDAPSGVSEDVEDRKAGQRYEKGALLGKGGFAKCYLFRHVGSGHECAAKCVEKASLKKERAKKKLLSEIRIHRSLVHPNIVRFEHFFEDSRFVYILLEHCDSQTLMELVRREKRLDCPKSAGYLSQLVEGVSFLQSKSIIHRDLKLGNIFLTGGGSSVRIGDFGLATKLTHSGERRKTMCGTPNYIAPEVLDSEMGHSFEVDVWSLGVILYTMLVGKPPFETKNVKQTYKRIQANMYSFPATVEVPADAKNLVRVILNKDPDLRPSLEAIRGHSFFSCLNECTTSSAASPTGSTTHKENVSTLGNRKSPERRRRSLPSSSPAGQVAKPSIVLPTTASPKQASEVTVKSWVDYSAKYGLGYMLSTGCVGVYFNDSTKLVVALNGHSFEYYERGTSVPEVHNLDEFPQALSKKVTLLKHFRGYLEKKNDEEGSSGGPAPVPRGTPSEATTGSLLYVKKWVRTPHAMFFRLSNRTVQVSFFDDSQVTLNAQDKLLTYFDKDGTSRTVSISDSKQYPDIAKRLKYTKDVLHRLIQSGSPSPLQAEKKAIESCI